ncbi:MAG: hypothetical protein ACXVZV_02490 [Terriglobales bacterium]
MTGYYKRITDELARDLDELRRTRSDTGNGSAYGRLVKRALLATMIAAVAALLVVYVGDYFVLRYRISAQKNPFGEITVQPYYAMHLKNGKTEFSFQPEQQERCVNSLFPHLGLTPCWYLRRHPDKRTDI